MQTLNQDIKEKSFKKIYLLYGDEPFLVGSYKKKLREAITGGDTMNFNYFEGKNPDVKEIISGYHAVFCRPAADPGGWQRLF